MAAVKARDKIPVAPGVPWICVSLLWDKVRTTFSQSLRFYFPGVLVGPYLEYAAYMSLVDGSLFTDIERTDKAVALKEGELSPFSNTLGAVLDLHC